MTLTILSHTSGTAQCLSFHDQPIPRVFETYLRRGLEGEWRQEGEWSQEVEPNTNLTVAISQFPADMTPQMKKRKLCPSTGNQRGAHSCLKTWVSKGVEKSERGLGESPSLAALLLLALPYISVGKREKHQDLPTSLVGWGGAGRSGEDPCQATKSYSHFGGQLFTCCILVQREQILNLNPREDPSGSQIPRATCHTQRKPICMASQGRPAWPLSFKATCG